MPEDADSIIKSTLKGWAILGGLVSDLILKHCSRVIGAAFGKSSGSVCGRERCNLLMDPIDISSSDDSDFREIDNYVDDSAHEMIDSATSAGSRILPSWASSPPLLNASGRGGSREVSSSKRPFLSNGNPYNFTSRTQDKSQAHPSTSGASSSHVGRDGNSRYVGNDHEKHLLQQASKRGLPPSFYPPPPPNSKFKNSVSNISGGVTCESQGNFQSPWSSSSAGNMADHYGKGNDNDIVIYGSRGNRVLPSSLMQGRSSQFSPYSSWSEPGYHSVVTEERVAVTDETVIFQAAMQDLSQPKHELTLPEDVLTVSLLRHQKIGLAWMVQKETSSHCLGGILADDQGLGKTVSMIALIQIQRELQEKSKSGDIRSTVTETLNLVDDDDDNSSASLDKVKLNGQSDDVKVIPEADNSFQGFRSRRPAAGTLVVCPASVLRQWERELLEKVTKKASLSVLVYHGGNRTRDPAELAKYDVVLTTYSIVANEVPKLPLVNEDDDEQKNGEEYGLSSEFSDNKKRKLASISKKKKKKARKGIDTSEFDIDTGTLARVGWFRVILDEAQTIKNHRTQVARACCGLRAKRRWCLSGTPIQNAIDELFSYFRFLRYDPYNKYKAFRDTIKIPISRNSVHGYRKLQTVLRILMLRRTKATLIDGEPIINLPPKTINLEKVDFSPEERDFYRKLEAESRSKFKAYAAAGTVNQNYANILLMLLRLRQACDHPQLVKGFSSDSVRQVSTEAAKGLPRKMLIELIHLFETSRAICHLCKDPPEDAVVTICGHVFCYQCVAEYLTGEDNKCPVPKCKESLGADVVFSEATLRRCLSQDDDIDFLNSSEPAKKSRVLKNEYSSSKIKAALDILKKHCRFQSNSEQHDLVPLDGGSSSSGEECSMSKDEKPVKAIVFSQWTGMLNLVEESLKHSSIEYRRLDGTMTLAARDRAVKEFNSCPEVTVMLMSLKAGNLGLNMVAACHVILLDLWWNPTTEDQAVDRAHRIGQTRPVTVSRLTIKDTVEDRILALQEEKRKMVASAFGEDQSGSSAAHLTPEDLKYLFFGSKHQPGPGSGI